MSWIELHRDAQVIEVAPCLGLLVSRSRGASGGSCACSACGAERRHTKSGDKRGAVGIRRDGRGWRCFQCDASGDALDFVAYALTGRRLRDADADGRAKVREWFEGDQGRAVVAAPVVTLPLLDYIDTDELRALFESLIQAADVPEVAAALWARGIDPAKIDLLAAVRPAGACSFSWCRTWERNGHCLVFPLHDELGRARSARARRITQEQPKSVAPYDRASAGLVMANPAAREMLRTGAVPSAWTSRAPLRVVIAEGEIDYLVAACEETAPGEPYAVLGITSGAWSDAHAARIPDGSEVIIATDHDAAGDRYAAQVAASLASRNVTLLRWEAAA